MTTSASAQVRRVLHAEGTNCNPQPSSLRPLWLVMLLLMLTSVFVTLEITLRISSANAGLGPANSSFTYLHYAWTIFPAFVLALLSTWSSDALGSISLPNKTLMDPFFQQLVTSPYAVPIKYLGDPRSSHRGRERDRLPTWHYCSPVYQQELSTQRQFWRQHGSTQRHTLSHFIKSN